MTNDRILISTEVTEELDDLINILEYKSNVKNVSVLVNFQVDLNRAEHLKKIDQNSIFIEKKLFKLKFLQKIYGLFFLFKVVLLTRPNVLYSGFSMLKHRLLSKIFNISHIAYFRGLMFDSNNVSGFSDKLRYGILGIVIKNLYIFNAYEADKILTISEINKNFIIERGVEIEKIFLISPPWLKDINSCLVSASSKITKVVFVTQAFNEHGHTLQHNSQVSFLKKLDEFCRRCNQLLIVRIHPRDYYDYSKLDFRSEVQFDSDPSIKFLSSLSSESIIISPLSTLAFEILFLDGNVLFYSTDKLDIIYSKTYQKLGIPVVYGNDFKKNNCDFYENRLLILNVFAEENN